MRPIDADALEKWMKRDDWGTPDERWRPESEFGAIIDEQPTVGEWISVKKRLPKDDGIDDAEEVLVCDKNGDRGTLRAVYLNRYLSETTVTHWMPLPEPPEETKGEEE